MISKWARIEELELKPLVVPDKSPATRTRIQAKETEMVQEKLQKLKTSASTSLYLLDETGKPRTTQDWAKLLESAKNNGAGSGDIIFGIASSLGWSATLKKEAKSLISFGPQTLSHELAKVVLLEQLYRAMSVIEGHPYHHEG